MILILENGEMIKNMAKELKYYMIILNMKDNIKMALNMEKENSRPIIEMNIMKVNLTKERDVVKVIINSKMETHMKASGVTINAMDKVNLHGVQERLTMVSGRMTLCMELVTSVRKKS